MHQVLGLANFQVVAAVAEVLQLQEIHLLHGL
jgi:hypothetical protein